MTSKEQSSSYGTRLSLYERLIATHPQITRKGAAYAYTSHNGHMFPLLSPWGVLGLRLPKGERDDFLKKFGTVLFESHGAVMKEYVTVPPILLNSWLEGLPSDAAEITCLLAIADARPVDYQKAVKGGLSTDVQLALAYDSARSSASAALRAAGYRVVRGNNEHYRTLEALEFSVDPEQKMIRALDALRRKRNTGTYDDYGLVTQARPISPASSRRRCANRSRTGFARITRTRWSECSHVPF
jgi:hypothetical protein